MARRYRRRRVLRRARLPRRINYRNQIIHAKMALTLAEVGSLDSSGHLALNYTIRPGQFTDFASYATLYDVYRINKIVFVFYPAYNAYVQNATAATANSGTMVRFLTAVDYDDDVTFGTFAEGLQHWNAKVHLLSTGRKIAVKFTPATLGGVQSVNDSGTKTQVSANQQFKKWMDTYETQVAFRGLKTVYAGQANQAIRMDPIVKVYFSFKQHR